MMHIVLVLAIVLGLALALGLLLWSRRRSVAWETRMGESGIAEQDWKCLYCEALQSHERDICSQCGSSRLAS